MGLSAIDVLHHYLDGNIANIIELFVITNASFINLLSSQLQMDHIRYDIKENQEGEVHGYRRWKHLCLKDLLVDDQSLFVWHCDVPLDLLSACQKGALQETEVMVDRACRHGHNTQRLH